MNSTESRPAATQNEKADRGWGKLYFVGGLAAVIMVVFFRRNSGAELMIARGFGIFDAPEVAPSSAVFPRATGLVGIVVNGLALGYFVALLVAPSLVWLPPTLSALFRLAWHILIAVGLFRLWARSDENRLQEPKA